MEFTSILQLITKYIRLGRDILVPEENMCRLAADATGLVRNMKEEQAEASC